MLGLLSLLGCGWGVGVALDPTASQTRMAVVAGPSLLIHAEAEDQDSRVHFEVDDVFRVERIGANSSMRLLSPEAAAQFFPMGVAGFEDGMAHVSAQRPDDVPLIFRVRAWTTPRGESWPESPPIVARYCLGD